MISVKKAHHIIQDCIPEPRTVTIPLESSSRSVLAQEIRASFPQPRFDNSAMDGFAVRTQDTAGASKENSVELKLTVTIKAGSREQCKIQAGECARIMTGAPVPEGADAVVMVENTSGFNEEKTVEIFMQAKQGDNIRLAGEEIQKDEILIEKGTEIDAGAIGVLATFGFDNVKIFKPVDVSIFATGDELKDPGEPLSPGEIYNSNLPVLHNLIKNYGSPIIHANRVKDNPESLEAFLAQALKESDIVIASGGVSMGKYDYVRDVLFKLGVKEHFWKVAQQPGKPLFFGTAENTLIFGIPGNPVSSYICFMEYIRPVLMQWKGGRSPEKIKAELKTPFPANPEKHRFLFGNVWSENGSLFCRPTEKLGSHMLTSALNANAILEAEPNSGDLPEGTMISVNLLPGAVLT